MSREIKFRAWNLIDKCMCDNSTTLTNLRGFIKSKHYHPMQYTGLKDKNGVEIYEGDVCKVEGSGNCTVEICPLNGVEFKAIDNEMYHTTAHDCLVEQDLFFVIGNIHENPELLK